MAIDLYVHDCGSIVIFLPNSPAAREWFDENVERPEFDWHGGVVAEPRYAGPIINAAVEAGFSVRRGRGL
ncbi:MAG: hypothetical protein MUE39_09345 [Gammaproteobacteria bacterium]|jgi:hypothetical protein|nr:hypothetical protein [Gammaproteobacteria bacterium]